MFVRKTAKWLGHSIIRLSDFGKDQTAIDLTGDRNVEWSWVAAHLPETPGAVLDFGSGDAFLGLMAAMKGGRVTALDLQRVQLPYEIRSLETRTGDILDMDFDEKQFDVIINCSSVEHVGLAGRYGSKDVPDGDLIAMDRLRRLLRAPGGIMILTVPIGKDSVFHPWHRVYGTNRLHLLLRGFEFIRKEYWSKRTGRNTWIRVAEKEALAVQPSECFYALGLFVLKANRLVAQK
jgi:hypothetical protein